jgi:hypothetical protein
MNVQNQFSKYIATEIPKFDARWVVDDYKINDQSQATMELIDIQLNKKPKNKLQNTIYFQDSSNLSTYSIDSKSVRGNTIRLRRIDDQSDNSLDHLDYQ